MPTDPEFWSLVFLQGITLAVLLISWAGLLIPVFPGLLVMWLATLMYAVVQQLAGRMNWVDWVLFALITLLAIGGGIVDNIIIARKMRGHEIPWRSILLALVAGLIASVLIQELRLQETASRQERERAAQWQELERMRSDLLSAVSHEFKTPLTVIRTADAAGVRAVILIGPTADPTAPAPGTSAWGWLNALSAGLALAAGVVMAGVGVWRRASASKSGDSGE